MGRPDHVTENMAVLAIPKLDAIALASLFG